MFIFQSKDTLDGEILVGKITHHLDPAIWKMPGACLGMGIPHSILVHHLLAIEIRILFTDTFPIVGR